MSKSKTIGTKISPVMYDMVEEIIEENTHLTKGELTRAALRVFIRERYPWIFYRYIGPPGKEVVDL